MSKHRSRKPEPEWRLEPAPEALAREEDKQIIRSVRHAYAVAWCIANAVEPVPKVRDWENAVDVLTFLRHCEWAMGGNPTAAQIAAGCSKRQKKMSERTAQRSLGLLLRLGVLFTVGQGPGAAERTILYARLREMISAGVQVATEEQSSPQYLPRQTESLSEPVWRGNGELLAGQKTEFGGAILSTPLPYLTTTTTGVTEIGGASVDCWVVVVELVAKAGVNQAKKAVGFVRDNGGTSDDVRAIVEHWRTIRDGYKFPQHVLYRRLEKFDPDVPAVLEWQAPDDLAWLEENERELARQANEKANRALEQKLIADRAAYDAKRAELAEERARTGVSLLSLAKLQAPELAAGMELFKKTGGKGTGRAKSLTFDGEPDTIHRPRAP